MNYDYLYVDQHGYTHMKQCNLQNMTKTSAFGTTEYLKALTEPFRIPKDYILDPKSQKDWDQN